MMTREEAIRRIKAWNLGSDDMEVLATAIPELKENEDERIRRTLVEYFGPMAQLDLVRGVPIQKIRDWLEKQKESMEKEYVFRPLAGTDITIAAQQAVRKANEGDRLVLAFNGAYIPVSKGYNCNVNKIVDMYDTFTEKQKEQKPAEKQDYTDLNDLESAIHRGFLSAGVENVPVEIIKETAQECLAQMKPAEWSEEDEKMRDRILEILNKYGNIPVSGGKVQLRFNKEYMWLRHLYERFSPQPHWKPSEEQMQYLLSVINDPNNIGAESCYMTIKSLYNDLKKL